MHEISRAYPGTAELQLLLNLADGQRVSLTSNKLKVEVVPEFRQRIDELLAPGNFRLLTSTPKPKSNGRKRPR